MKRIESIEVARGIAALLVVFFHTTGIIGLQKYYGDVPFANFWTFGFSGVDFFFVLSGFVIYYSASSGLGIRNNCIPYLKLRIIRIYPPYLVACALILPLIIFVFPKEISVSNAIKDIFLLPRPGTPFINVAWTLKHEILFYAMFMIFFLSRTAGWVLFAAWALLICLLQPTINEHGHLIGFIFNNHNLEFLAGLLIAYQVKKGMTFHRRLIYPGTLAFLITGICEWQGLGFSQSNQYHLLYGASSCLILMGLTALPFETQGLFSKLMLTLGKASYSIYLIHFTLLSASIKVLSMALPNLNSEAAWLVLVITSTAGGVFYWKYVEVPGIELCKKLLGNPRLQKSGV